MIPRIRGKVFQIEGHEKKEWVGKFFFELWMTELGTIFGTPK